MRTGIVTVLNILYCRLFKLRFMVSKETPNTMLCLRSIDHVVDTLVDEMTGQKGDMMCGHQDKKHTSRLLRGQVLP